MSRDSAPGAESGRGLGQEQAIISRVLPVLMKVTKWSPEGTLESPDGAVAAEEEASEQKTLISGIQTKTDMG